MMTIRCYRTDWLANPRLGRFRINGIAAALNPKSRRNSRRDECRIEDLTSFLGHAEFMAHWQFVFLHIGRCQCGSRDDFDHQFANTEILGSKVFRNESFVCDP